VPKVLYSPTSPYSAKVRMAAAYANIPVDATVVDTNANPPELLESNPLGKIPVLVTDEGAIFDSRAITQYLNRVSGGALFPRNPAKRTEAEKLEALADGICDCLLAHVYERRVRPEEKVHQPWLDRQWEKAARALDHLTSSTPGLPKRLTAGHIALRAMLAYLDLRFPGKWEQGRTKLKRWAARFDEKSPELTAYLPHG
jgi:glutathione S-transferase